MLPKTVTVDSPKRQSDRAIFFLVLLEFCLFNYIVPQVIDSFIEPLRLLAACVVFGQLGLLAVWAALGPQKLAVSMACLALLFGCLMGGMAVDEGRPVVRNVAHLGLALPLVLLAASSPLFVVRTVLGWRIIPLEARKSEASQMTGQYRIADILKITALVAVALVAARWALVLELDQGGQTVDDAELLLTCLFVVAWSALALPTVWGVLAAKSLWKGLVGVGAYTAALAMIPSVLIEGLRMSVDDLLPLLAQAGAMVPVVLGLLLARWRGYVLLGRFCGRALAVVAAPDDGGDTNEP